MVGARKWHGSGRAEAAVARNRPVKCVVWDLDNTVWHGVLIEGDEIRLRPGVRRVVETLDRRGILQSIASRNDPRLALETLARLGLSDYFLYPQIGWSSKSYSIRQVANALNIGLDAVAFVDDDPFERDEVASELPDVRCLDVDSIPALLDRPEFIPRFVTAESGLRRQLYLAESRRAKVAETFVGPKEQFLCDLGLRFEIAHARTPDLRRAEELTVRTHQLNTTGHTYSYDQLDVLCRSDDHLVLVARLADRFGDYGTIGLAVVEKRTDAWEIRLLLFSCRVTSRGVVVVLINHLKRLARGAGVRLQADMKPTVRNRVMYLSFIMNGFELIAEGPHGMRLEADLGDIPEDPSYVAVEIVP
jgi:FkbH-like protein